MPGKHLYLPRGSKVKGTFQVIIHIMHPDIKPFIIWWHFEGVGGLGVNSDGAVLATQTRGPKFDPQQPCESWAWCYVLIRQSWEDRGGLSPGTSWPALLKQSANYRFYERPCLQTNKTENHHDANLCTQTHHVCEHMHESKTKKYWHQDWIKIIGVWVNVGKQAINSWWVYLLSDQR